MANIAVIIAGGSGHRMGQDIPKQFINVRLRAHVWVGNSLCLP
jgi:2-C-methyl-D-erythritol 4-phosphate cytidylyltransferase